MATEDFNTKVIDEFRANGGRVGGMFENMPLLLLHTTGARSGLERINPLAYQDLGDDVAIFASKAGAPTDPDWYRNLVAHPEVTVERGTEVYAGRARVATGEERERIWSAQKAAYAGFAEYEAKAGREIPVVVIERV